MQGRGVPKLADDVVLGAPPKHMPDLSGRHGSAQFFIHPVSGLTYTEGVKALAEGSEAYWLIDAIFSWRHSKRVKAAGWLQVWTLKKRPPGSAYAADLICCDGDGKELARQRIRFTDFPAQEVTLWVEHGRLLLPSEH